MISGLLIVLPSFLPVSILIASQVSPPFTSNGSFYRFVFPKASLFLPTCINDKQTVHFPSQGCPNFAIPSIQPYYCLCCLLFLKGVLFVV